MNKPQIELAIAHAYARGKKNRELVAREKKRAQKRALRGSTPEQIVRRMAHQEK